MKKTDWLFYIIVPLLSVWLIDQTTKLAFNGASNQPRFYGPLGISVFHNHGAILGSFSELPQILRVVSLSTGGAFLLFAFFIAQYLIPTPSLLLRSGLSLLMGGILGNVTDRIVNGYAIDFLFLKIGRFASPIMNFADIIQWVGYVMIVTALFRDRSLFWRAKELRKSYWVQPDFQWRYCLILVAFGLALSLITGTFAYSYLKITIEILGAIPPSAGHAMSSSFIAVFSLISIVTTMIFFCVGLVLSHRIAGPIRAFENFVEDLNAGKPRPLKLRDKDEFKQLEQLASKIESIFRKKG